MGSKETNKKPTSTAAVTLPVATADCVSQPTPTYSKSSPMGPPTTLNVNDILSFMDNAMGSKETNKTN